MQEVNFNVAVVGGGLAGLAAAHRVHELRPDAAISLYEAGNRTGGVIDTTSREGFLIERAADMFTTRDPYATGLCDRIGFTSQLIGAEEEHRQAFLIHCGKLTPIPAGFSLMAPHRFWPMLTTPLLSWRGKLRLGWEYFTPASRQQQDESLASFARRRLGREAYERIVQPLVGGIYTADPEQLSMDATMRQFVEMERKHGGIIRGVLRRPAAQKTNDKKASGARYNIFRAPRLGMKQLTQAIASRLPQGCIELNTPVAAIARTNDTWQVTTAAGARTFNAVILAAGARGAGRLLEPVHPALSQQLLSIPHSSAAVVAMGFRRKDIAHPLNGFGAVAPLVEQRKIVAASFSSVKFAGRAPDGCVLLRAFVGGACQPELLELDDQELRQLVIQEFQQLIGLNGEPLVCDINRWNDSMPQYHVGHVDKATTIEQLATELPGLQLAGNYLRGVGIPFCIHSGEQAAASVLEKQEPEAT